ncbi:MAG TPA: TIGR03032 family protein [Thermoanaerobaculia bacterium]|jgi:uncharacterized protein (TIGR03032 family)
MALESQPELGESQPTSSEETGPEAFRSYHTPGLPHVLRELGASVLISTYQSGRVIVVRLDGEEINTHLRAFPRPMGIAVAPHRLALGVQRQVWDYQDQTEIGSRLDPPGLHDACFLPRACHFTGQIDVHELAFAADGLWIVNTRFSCLCGLDGEHSFVPRWQPPFVTALAPEDRCHLNGLAVMDGAVRWVTAFGATDAPQGWRENKAHGGLLMEVPSGEIVARGLSMPHSPRWYAGKLWVLESGRGTVATVDPATGRVSTVAELPGFTRGLAFAGPFAFVGLSQVRGKNSFGALPLTDRCQERLCGVWVLDIRSGKTVGSLRFDGLVQEIFDVQLLVGQRFPEIAEPESEIAGNAFVLPSPSPESELRVGLQAAA